MGHVIPAKCVGLQVWWLAGLPGLADFIPFRKMVNRFGRPFPDSLRVVIPHPYAECGGYGFWVLVAAVLFTVF